MKLTDLDPRFIRALEPRTELLERIGWQEFDTKDEANGIIFLCPKCFRENGGAVGTHSIVCWEPSVPPEMPPGPARWTMKGTSLEDLTLSPSIQITSGCMWHGFVRNGEVFDA